MDDNEVGSRWTSGMESLSSSVLLLSSEDDGKEDVVDQDEEDLERSEKRVADVL